VNPWDLAAPITDKELWPLWQKFSAHDFYFGVINNPATDTTLVFIVPIDYYEQFGLMLDDSIPIKDLLPKNLEEIMACIYETDRMIETTRYDMIDHGFVNDSRFQKFVDAAEWFSGD
jgi:hypothetical protein